MPEEARPLPACSVFFAPIPVLSWLLPFAGHLALTDSRGLLSEFAGPRTVRASRADTVFGRPTRAVGLPPAAADPEAWDAAVARAGEAFSRRGYGLFTCNCHHYVAEALAGLPGGPGRLSVPGLVWRYVLRMRALPRGPRGGQRGPLVAGPGAAAD